MSFISSAKHYKINRRFLCDYSNNIFIKNSNDKISGLGLSLNSKNESLLASIGEYIERDILYNPQINFINAADKIEVYSFAKNSIIEINKHLFLNELKNCDSMGFATHTNSLKCIENSFKEFFERQCYIFNYLSKSSAEKVFIDTFKEKEIIDIFFRGIPVEFYNISLIKEIYVILGLALKNDELYIGINCSNFKDEALYGVIKEMLLCKNMYKNEKNNKNLYNMNEYSKIYLNLSGRKIWDSYSYLRKSVKHRKYSNLKSFNLNINNLCKKLYERFKMDPLLKIITNKNYNKNNIVTTKVFDLNWFKNMLVSQYNDKLYYFIETATGKPLNRSCNFLPFP